MIEDIEDILSAQEEDYADCEISEIYPEGFVEDAKKLARQYIGVYFEGKQMYCGGPIPKKVLDSPKYSTLVVNTDIIDGVEKTYNLIECEEPDAENGSITKEMQFVIAMLQECAKLKIPKCFAGGLLLMHLQLCEGIDF